MRYILEADKEAYLICGMKKGNTRGYFFHVIEDGNIEQYLEEVSIDSGDMIYIPSGTVHAITGGLKLIECMTGDKIEK